MQFFYCLEEEEQAAFQIDNWIKLAEIQEGSDPWRSGDDASVMAEVQSLLLGRDNDKGGLQALTQDYKISKHFDYFMFYIQGAFL